MVPRPIHRLRPFSTQPPAGSGRAEVSRATESEPWSGSVSANAPSLSIRAMPGSQRSFCSSEPHIAIDIMARPACTPRNTPRLPSPRCSSIVTSPHAIGLIPGHPYPWMSSPTMPNSGSRRTSGQGISARSQYGPMTGTTSSLTNRRTVMKCDHCSSVNCSRTEKKSVPRDSPRCSLATCVIISSFRTEERVDDRGDALCVRGQLEVAAVIDMQFAAWYQPVHDPRVDQRDDRVVVTGQDQGGFRSIGSRGRLVQPRQASSW